MQTGTGGSCPFAKGLGGATLADPEIQADPYAFFQAMRTQDPVYYDAKINMYLVSRFDDVETVLRDDKVYSCEQGYVEQYSKGFFDEFKAILIKEGGGFFKDAIMTDPPVHTRVRKLLAKGFTAHRVATLEPRITALVVELVEEILNKAKTGNAIDVVTEFAVPLTSAIICEQLGLGLSRKDSHKVQGWSNAVVAQIGNMQNREQMQRNARQICELQNHIIACMRARENDPREDIISDLVHARTEDGDKFTFEEAVSLIRAILIAGNETTAIALTNLFFILATREEIGKLLREAVDEGRLLTRFVEELLRFDPPTRGLMRMTTCETVLGGVPLPKGAHLLVLYGSACDDETQFPRPRDFDLSRKNLNRHLAFGAGTHHCIGAPMARMEIRVAAKEVVHRIADIKLTIPTDEVRYVPTVISHAIARLPVTLTRRSL